MIAVTGATGAVGGRVAALLAERGVPQRLVVRDASRAPRIEGAEVADGASYADGDAMRRAFEGADTVFLVSAGEDEHRVDLHRSAVDAAVAAGVERIVYQEARASRAPSGAPAWEIEGWVTTYAAIAAGDLEQVSGDVERLTGRKPITLDEFLGDNPESYRHLVRA